MSHMFPPLLPKDGLEPPVLVLAAHPDDDVIGCGGMLAWHVGRASRYGVVLDDDLSVNEQATEALRAKLSEERGEPNLFDFGGTIDELKARCKAETSFDPPSQPRPDRRIMRLAEQVATQDWEKAAE